MIEIRRANDRGKENLGWLDTSYTFSFANYHDPKHVRFKSLRVLNEDIVAPGMGFDMHPHNDMEIITYVISGALKHQDSLGHGGVVKRGDVQHITAGKGILHSEHNASSSEPVHLYQIWIMPREKGLTPSYNQLHFSEENKLNKLCHIASGNPTPGTLLVNQSVDIYASILETGLTLKPQMSYEGGIWLQVVSGELLVDGQLLTTGDGAGITDNDELLLEAKTDTEFLLFNF